MHLAPGQAELAIALLNPAVAVAREQRASSRLSLDFVSCCNRMGLGGAGYGNRTRLTGLGSQDITTMLSPLAACDYRRPAPFKSTSDAHPHEIGSVSCAVCRGRGYRRTMNRRSAGRSGETSTVARHGGTDEAHRWLGVHRRRGGGHDSVRPVARYVIELEHGRARGAEVTVQGCLRSATGMSGASTGIATLNVPAMAADGSTAGQTASTLPVRRPAAHRARPTSPSRVHPPRRAGRYGLSVGAPRIDDARGACRTPGGGDRQGDRARNGRLGHAAGARQHQRPDRPSPRDGGAVL